MKRMFFFVLISVLLVGAGYAEEAASVETILERMAAHDEWQTKRLAGYEAVRTFYAANPRFNLDSTLLVETSFKKPETMDSRVVKQDGSSLIRDRVFKKILEAENETHSGQAKKDVDLTPANYSFKLVGVETCGERKCYRLDVSPRRKDKYSIDGDIWVDAEDFAIVRVHGAPAKRPSFWTRKTEIEKRYLRVDGVWLPETTESTSDILIGGQSKLSIRYAYKSIQTE